MKKAIVFALLMTAAVLSIESRGQQLCTFLSPNGRCNPPLAQTMGGTWAVALPWLLGSPTAPTAGYAIASSLGFKFNNQTSFVSNDLAGSERTIFKYDDTFVSLVPGGQPARFGGKVGVGSKTFGNLGTGTLGEMVVITDANTTTPGATVTAGASTGVVLAYFNSSNNWIVIQN